MAIAAFVACVIGARSFPARSDPLIILTEADMPPYAMRNDKDEISGIATLLVRLILARAGINYRIIVYPWLRSYEIAARQSDSCVSSMIISEQRLPRFKWVGPLTEDHYVLFAKAYP